MAVAVEQVEEGSSRIARAAGWLIVKLRFVIVAAWIAGGIAATIFLPSLQDAGNAPLNGLVPRDAPAIQAQVRSAELFRVPILTDVAVVQRDPNGLSGGAQQRVAERAAEASRDPSRASEGELAFALPILNAEGRIPASKEQLTTAITYLFFAPGTTIWEKRDGARAYEQQIDSPDDHLVGATGPALGRIHESEQIENSLPLVEVATIALIALVLGLTFRSFGAPLVALLAAAVAYLVTVRGVAWVGQKADLTVPQEVEPMVVVILLGIVTDYAIFFLSGFRARLAAGDDRLEAARRTTARYLPIVFTAGLIVAAGTAALIVGKLEFFRAFGPGMALTALIGLLAATTLIPALLAIFGRAIFWPGKKALTGTAPEELVPTGKPPLRARIAHLATAKPAAAAIVLLTGAALLAAATGLRETSLGFTLVTGLPDRIETKKAADAAAQGFAAGVLAPTEVLLEGRELGSKHESLVHLEQLLERERGVAGVLGPREEPDALIEGAAVSTGGNAARYAVILQDDPLGGDAIDELRTLRDRMPALVQEAGLGGATVAFAGQTALAEETVSSTLGDLGRIALAALGINLLLLMLFLRSLVAPLFLLVASVLAVAATLGLTTYVFQSLLGYDTMTYYVPFAAAVLLVALGSDYNVFVVGQIRDEARRRPVREAVAVAAPRASRAITVAGVALAGSFALLAIVPLQAFHEIAFALAVGVLLDAFVVRSLLVPALISLFGDLSWWPGRSPELTPPDPAPAATPTTEPLDRSVT